MVLAAGREEEDVATQARVRPPAEGVAPLHDHVEAKDLPGATVVACWGAGGGCPSDVSAC